MCAEESEKTTTGIQSSRPRAGPAPVSLAGVLMACAAGTATAQQPVQHADLQQVPQPADPQPPSIRQLFASTLAAVATAGGSALTVGLTQAITGGLTSWFNRRLKVDPNGAATGAPPPGYPSANSTAGQAPPDYGAAQAYPLPDYGAAQAYPPPQQYPTASNGQPYPPADGNVQYYDAQTGVVATPDPAFAAAAVGDGSLYAGLAFEVHALQPGGAAFPVDPSAHEFRTGDRFVVYYRPTLPGRMDVYNINAAGQQTHIDSVEIAAGQLAQLGPYEFAALTGDERLRLVLQPCTTPALTSATRDIVNVSQPAAAGASGLGLASCGPATRSVREVRTRDIRKVALEGTTGFALDPVLPQEQASGRLEAREVTIVFRHR
jgi:hypothetical protein